MSALPTSALVVPSADDIAAFEESHKVAAKKPGRALRIVTPPASPPAGHDDYESTAASETDGATIVAPAPASDVTPIVAPAPTSDPYWTGSFSASDVAPILARPTVAPRVVSSAPRKNAPFPDNGIVRVLIGGDRVDSTGNPCKSPTGKNYARWASGVRDGRTVAETIANGFNMADIKCCVGRRWLKVEKPQS